MKFLSFTLNLVLTLGLGTASSFAQEPARTSESSVHSKHPLSYYSLIMDPAPDAVERELGPKCVATLREHFGSGKSVDPRRRSREL